MDVDIAKDFIYARTFSCYYFRSFVTELDHTGMAFCVKHSSLAIFDHWIIFWIAIRILFDDDRTGMAWGRSKILGGQFKQWSRNFMVFILVFEFDYGDSF